MSEKSIFITSDVAASSNDTTSQTIPNGERWMLMSFGCADINTGDNKSSIYVLRWAGNVLRMAALTGNTFEVTIGKEIIGDGVKQISIQRFNRSSTNKACPCWLIAAKRE